MSQQARRWSGEWATPADAVPPVIDVLVPTADRPAELAVTLAGLAAQDGPVFSVIVSDQSTDAPGWSYPAAGAMLRVLRAQGRHTDTVRHLPRRGLAEHRHFLLGLARASYVLFLDDDVWLEPGSVQRLHAAIGELRCGFLGMAPQGLSYLGDVRPDEQAKFIEWRREVAPEWVRPGTAEYDRWPLHNAANLTHIAGDRHVSTGGWIAYRVAWLGGCVLYDRVALLESGGFDFWPQLPAEHAGEDAAAQWRVMERYGGAGLLPSGAVHLEAPTTIPRRETDATDMFG